ncbi:hypothetical protein HanRHA438_Chr08g0337361 [Helianthus annuus]|uniref:Uncharacterized protein n=1 Tax=Helianthus annuus TaxID=4232 RepID=A0A251U3T2_HELAN|nr:hypothetical protein HanXRQr2_Chr08g0326241 [Helianthus annuus]KAJ0537969.1 hypothetical protein HanHA300_Chr08g0269691 [Helianthus annuus]KAJ0545681.1 hypothetical protein HanIR_Chr08g0352481 [Helianthus annuus]KAJ0552556.1 hypothetical protein HanHA89_Chr08g0286531 [Helianthus annuus]KAJ0718252.1 hypothetical protein HanLR1_Chr08g0268561 [Helianthus annuus]
MKTNSSNTGNASADMKPDVQHSGIRATMGNRRKSIDVIRFRAQPDEEQNRVYGDGDEFNPDRTRMFARMKRETMRCKHCSDEMNERRRKMRLEQDVPTMNYVCKKNRGIANGIDKDSQNLKNGQVSVPSSSHERAEDGYHEGRSIHADGEQFKSTIRGKDEIPSMKFATRADDEEDVHSKEDESRIREQETEENNHELQVSVLENVFMHRQKRNRESVIHFSDKERKALVTLMYAMKWEFMTLMYATYLNVLVYYYKFKYIQTRVHKKEIVKKVMDLKKKNRSQNDEIQGTIADQTERNTRSDNAAEHKGEHYALFAGNDWEGMKKMQAKRPEVSSYMLLNIIKFRGVC